jgi:hypothetical protein
MAVINMMTEDSFWDKFRENHNLKYYATKKNKEIQKSKYLYQTEDYKAGS